LVTGAKCGYATGRSQQARERPRRRAHRYLAPVGPGPEDCCAIPATLQRVTFREGCPFSGRSLPSLGEIVRVEAAAQPDVSRPGSGKDTGAAEPHEFGLLKRQLAAEQAANAVTQRGVAFEQPGNAPKVVAERPVVRRREGFECGQVYAAACQLVQAAAQT